MRRFKSHLFGIFINVNLLFVIQVLDSLFKFLNDMDIVMVRKKHIAIW